MRPDTIRNHLRAFWPAWDKLPDKPEPGDPPALREAAKAIVCITGMGLLAMAIGQFISLRQAMLAPWCMAGVLAVADVYSRKAFIDLCMPAMAGAAAAGSVIAVLIRYYPASWPLPFPDQPFESGHCLYIEALVAAASHMVMNEKGRDHV